VKLAARRGVAAGAVLGILAGQLVVNFARAELVYANSLPHYYLPFAYGERHTVSQGNGGSFSHTGIAQYAWDFAGDAFGVRAAREGTVTAIQQSYGVGGCLASYHPNYVVVSSIEDDGTEHDELYLHIAHNSVTVSLNQSVTRGSILAVSDSSGYVCPDPPQGQTCPPTCPAAHLHFMVMNPSGCAPAPWWCQSVASSFLDSNVLAQDTNGVPLVNQSVTSSNVVMPHCNVPTLSGQPAAPQNAHTSVTFSVTFPGGNSSCPNPNYHFWIQPPGGAWQSAQPYSATAIYTWPQDWRASPGPWHVEVDVRDASETWSYDTTSWIAYQLNGCSAASMTVNPPSPQLNANQVTVTGASTCPGTPTYQFWRQAPGSGWQIVQDYSTANVYTWAALFGPVGTHTLQVYARDQGATDSYEVASTPVSYQLSVTPCGTPSLYGSPASPGGTGNAILFTASTSGCPNPMYRFWVQAPGGSWVIEQDYTFSNTFDWGTWNSPGTQAAATYKIEVDVVDAAERTSYDAVANINYVLIGCTSASLGTSPTSPATKGSTILLTGSASCLGTPQYRFWIKSPGGAWVMVRDYDTNANYGWVSPSTAGTYGVEVDVRDQGGSASYETTTWINFVLT